MGCLQPCRGLGKAPSLAARLLPLPLHDRARIPFPPHPPPAAESDLEEMRAAVEAAQLRASGTAGWHIEIVGGSRRQQRPAPPGGGGGGGPPKKHHDAGGWRRGLGCRPE